ncbi:Cytochrome c, class I [Beggiatoa sp. PS]|nr:Cytochrome c, class I [Beggiatoa sp. PS]
MNKLTLTLCILTLGSSTAFAASTDLKGDIAAGQAKSALCIACHGPNGQGSPNPLWPKLAGQHASYIVQQLNNFKAQDRQEPTMSPMAAPLTEQEVHNLAAYFESQTLKLVLRIKNGWNKGKRFIEGGTRKPMYPLVLVVMAHKVAVIPLPNIQQSMDKMPNTC